MSTRTLPLLLCFLLALGCASASGGGTPDPEPSDDAGAEAETSYDGPLCCQITYDLTPDPHWQNCRYPCDPDAGISLRSVPWVCNVDAPASCADPACVLGSTCQGFNGYGVVVACNAPPYTSPDVFRGVVTQCP